MVMKRGIFLPRKSTRVCTQNNISSLHSCKRSNLRFDFLDTKGNIAKSKRSQVTIFIIIALVVLGAVLIYFALRQKAPAAITKELREPFDYFLSCIDNQVGMASKIAETQAGYVKLPEFSPGSDYMPFSSQLDFSGVAVPYWYYASGNGIIKEQFLTKKEIERQIEDYLSENLKNCDFSQFTNQGYEIELKEFEPSVSISDYSVKASVNSEMKVSFGNLTETKRGHSAETQTRLGRFYNIAKEVYDKEKKESFLEDYGVDALNLYAPVTGVEISCSPMIWQFQDVSEQLRDALEANTQSIKVKGKYYQQNPKNNEANKYFVINLSRELKEGEGVNFVYSKEFPSRIEVWPANNNLMIAEPVGLQEGLGILGFCYVPYNFIYDMVYPVLIQVYDNEEMFQFPVAVVVQKNVAREALPAAIEQESIGDICNKANTETEIFTYDTELAPVEADIKFKCFNDECNIGRTMLTKDRDAKLSAKLPQCANAIITADAEGYKEAKQIASTNEESSVDILMDKLYTLELNVLVDNKPVSDKDIVLVNFESEEIKSALYPEQRNISIAESYYNITLYVFKTSQITLPASTARQCVEVPRTGIAGFFGMKKEQCFDINFPSQTMTNVLYAGGKTTYYFTESELQNSESMDIYATSISIPQKAEDLPTIYDIFETRSIDIVLK